MYKPEPCHSWAASVPGSPYRFSNIVNVCTTCRHLVHLPHAAHVSIVTFNRYIFYFQTNSNTRNYMNQDSWPCLSLKKSRNWPVKGGKYRIPGICTRAHMKIRFTFHYPSQPCTDNIILARERTKLAHALNLVSRVGGSWWFVTTSMWVVRTYRDVLKAKTFLVRNCFPVPNLAQKRAKSTFLNY
jgi:hypothetical protein